MFVKSALARIVRVLMLVQDFRGRWMRVMFNCPIVGVDGQNWHHTWIWGQFWVGQGTQVSGKQLLVWEHLGISLVEGSYTEHAKL